MPIDQLAELLVRWRGTSGVLGRRRMLREGIQLLSGLDADERRLLARSLAEHGAPELAQQVEHRTGGTVSADQLWSVADGLLALEDHQIEHMVATLADPAERGRLAHAAVVHGAASSDDGPNPPPDHRARLDELPPPGPVVDGTGVDPVVTAGQPAPEMQPSTDDGDLDDRTLGGREPGSQELETPGPVETAPVEVQVHESLSDLGAAAPATTSAGDAVDAGQDASGVAAADGVALLQGLREAGTATTRLRVLHEHELADVDADTALAVMDTIPDGWQRRRAAQRLAEAGALPIGRLASVFARFARPADAAFVAGALVAAGQVRAAAFDGILPERVVRRLTVRSER